MLTVFFKSLAISIVWLRRINIRWDFRAATDRPDTSTPPTGLQ
jgi:hypothetical protein